MTDPKTIIGLNKYRRQADRLINDPGGVQQVYLETVKKAERNQGLLSKVWNELTSLFRLIKAWVDGSYREIPKQTLALIVGGLLYFLSPVDLVPDFLAGLGLLDDAVILGWIIRNVRGEIERFTEWEASH
ncbi:MAG: DUF1232 domain-containing protein [Firmicutes bacterium]|nr:DUF1232 domain-containing protein [Bacillota bacterium]